jgi:urea transport system permease protein
MQAPALAAPPPDAAQATPDTTQPAPDAATAAPDAATAVPDTPAADQAPAAAADTPAAAPAQPLGPPPTLAEALARFLEDDFSETDTGVTAVAASGDPRAATIVEALRDGRLLFSTQERKVYYKDKSDKLFDAETGDELTGSPPVDMAPVRINNRLRRTIDAALGGLLLRQGVYAAAHEGGADPHVAPEAA